MTDGMWALTYNRETDPWEATTGLKKTEVERPRIDDVLRPKPAEKLALFH